MSNATDRRTALVIAVLAALALGVALGSEWWLGLVPCALCLVERWPYRIAIGLALLAFLLPKFGRTLLLLTALTTLVAAGFGVVHFGTEQGWWPSPLPECAAPDLGHGTVAERLARMPALPSKPCDEPTYLVPGLPMSMALMNLVYALALTGFLAMSAVGSRRMR